MGTPLRGYFSDIPDGIDGVRATLRHMVKIAREFLKPNSHAKTQDLLYVRVTAQQAVQHVPEKDHWGEGVALHQFVRDCVRYVQDMAHAETIQYPDKTLQIGSGDCDDKALLFCCLANCIGYETRFIAIAVPTDDDPEGRIFSHVSGQLLIPRKGWTNAETIPIDDRGTKVPLGWFPPDASCVMLAHI